MEELTELIQNNVQMAPFISFGLLLLAGFNLPVSEDAMIFINALLAAKNPEYKIPLFLGVYAGAYFSDIICYWLGRTLGPKLWEIKFFAKMVTKEKVDKMSTYYNKYGIITLILGRFIPFGVRNGLFLTAGLSKMNFLKFALSDIVAATISCSIMFSLVFNYGEGIIEVIKKANLVIFGIAGVGLVIFLLKVIISKKKLHLSK